MYRHIPNLLTLLRLLSAPAVALILTMTTDPFWSLVALIIYIFASATDWLDGYLARRWQSVSNFGRMLDPIADKLMVIVMLLVLMGTSFGTLWLAYLPSSLSRAIMVSGLREFMAKQDFTVRRHIGAKLKTTCQLIALGFLIGAFIFPPTSSFYTLP